MLLKKKEKPLKAEVKNTQTTETLFDEQKALSRWGVYDSLAQVGVGSLVVASGVNGMINGGILGTGGQLLPMAVLLPAGSFSIVTGQEFAYSGVNQLCRQLEEWNKKVAVKENEEAKEETKEDTKEQAKDESKEEKKEETKEDSKEQPKDDSKEQETQPTSIHHESEKSDVARNFSASQKELQTKPEKQAELTPGI